MAKSLMFSKEETPRVGDRYLRPMEIRVLGPVEVGGDGELVALGGPRQRALFALLVAAVPDLVSTDGLIDGLWGEEASPGSRSTLQTYVSNLRQVLGDVLVHERGGYRLVVDPGVIDAVEFTTALEDSRVGLATDPEKVAVGLRRVLALWRGRPYADLVEVPGLESETRRLEALRLEAVELRIDAELACGRHSEVLAELEGLAEEHPTREHFRAQHMLALYRAGRQADALRAYRRSEAYLAETLGVDPSEELQDLELRILDHDESLRLGASRAVTQRFAFLVSEIEGSTRLWDRFPQAMATALADHDRILGEAIEEAGGRVVKHTGEMAVAVFPDAVAAVAAAEAMLWRLADTDWGEIGELRVRLGVDVGEAEARGDDFYGPPLNRASRLCAIGHGGQVLLSSAAERDVTASAPPGLQVRHLGEVPLRGMAAPERVSQLVFSGLPAVFPDLRLDAASGLDHGAEALSLPGYEVREPIGEGRFGVVWRAYQPSVGREVAVKIVRPEFAGRPSFVRRFEAEARTVARLAHPHIVPLIDFWRDATGAYLVLQLLEGGSLRETLSAGSLDEAARRRILHQVGAALDHAHAQGVIHGDFQPDNILLDEAGNAYLSDFGIAARLVDPEVVASMSSSPAFRAPEEPRSGPTKAADLFAFGMLTRHLLGDHPELQDLLARATSRHPENRYQSAAALLADLDEALGQQAPVVERPPVSRNPYKGLRAFDESDAPDFHGRDELVSALTGAIRGHRFVTVVGPSGSGKSSAVRAGLLPALAGGAVERSERWFRTVLTPGTHPLESLLEALEALAPEPAELLEPLENGDLTEATHRLLGDADGELVIVVDQFEEVFTLVDDPHKRDAFLDLFVQGVQAEGSRVRVVATLRADFYDRPLEHKGLDRLVRDGLVTVLRPTPEELLEMISRPAQAVGLRWEPGLPHRIAQEVVDQPGGLPLLQYALTELVERRHGDLLTGDDYQRTGGVAGALATRAEAVFRELAPSRQEAAREMLLRLVTVDEDAEATRRRVRRSELESLGIDREDLEPVLEAFTTERLLLADRDPLTRGPTVEVAHEALLREWPRLRAWIQDEQDALLLGRRLRAAIAEWEAAQHDDDYLLTGARLAPFSTWAQSASLIGEERAFLQASQERDQAEQAARARRRRVLTGVLASATVVAMLLASVAFAQSRRATEEAERALTAERQATARELAASAINALDEDPELSILLALEAVRTTRAADGTVLREAEEALHKALQASRLILTVPGAGASVAVSPDGSRLLTEGLEGVAKVWDAETGAELLSLVGHSASIHDVDWSPNGDLLATTGADGTARVWDAATGVLLHEIPVGSGPVFSVAFSPDGTLITTLGEEREGGELSRVETWLRVWETASGQSVFSTSAWSGRVDLGAESDNLVSFSPDGQLVIAAIAFVAEQDVGARTWDLDSGTLTHQLFSSEQFQHGIDVSPDGALLAGGRGLGVAIWDLADETILDEEETEQAFSVAFSKDGQLLASGHLDGKAHLWHMTAGRLSQVMTLSGHSGLVTSVAFVPGSERLVTAGADGTARVWDVSPPGRGELLTLPGVHEGPVANGDVEFSPDGHALVGVSGGPGEVRVWDFPTGNERLVIDGHSMTDLPNFDRSVFAVDMSRDGTMIATAALDGTARVWDSLTGEELLRFEGHLRDCREDLPDNAPHPSSCFVFDAKFDPDGARIATGGADGSVRIVDVESGAELSKLLLHTEFVFGLSWSPDGRHIATASWDGTAKVTDTATGDTVYVLDHPGDETVATVTYAPDGSLLVTGGFDGTVKIWDPSSGEEISSMNAGGPVFDIVFQPDGSRLATASSTVKLWDVATGREVIALDPPTGGAVIVGKLAFSPDGTALASRTVEAGPFYVWLLDINRLLDLAQDRVTRAFSDDECRTYLHLDACPTP